MLEGDHVRRSVSIPVRLVAGTWSADKRLFAGDDGSGAVWIVRDNRRPRRLFTIDPSYYNEGQTLWQWAPSGHRLLGVTGPRIVVFGPLTGASHRVTPRSNLRAAFLEPEWSPDGRLIEYARTTRVRGGCSRVDIGVAPALGGQFRQLVHLYVPTAADLNNARENPLGCGGGALEEALVNTAYTSWSPDGRTLLTAGPSFGGYPTLLLVDVAAGAVHERRLLLMSRIAWSPDGRRLAFESRRRAIAILTADGRRVRFVRHVARGDEGADLVWSPDARRLAIVSGGTLASVGANGEQPRTITRAEALVTW